METADPITAAADRVAGVRSPRLRKYAGRLMLIGSYGLALSLLMGRGTYDMALGVTALGIIGQIAVGPPGLYINSALKVFLAAGAGLFFQGVIMAHGLTGKSPYAVLWCLLATLGVTQLAQQPKLAIHRLPIWLILLAFVVINLLFDAYWHHWESDGKSGLLSNMHYLSQFVVMTLPILAYAVCMARSRERLVLLLVLLGDLWLLMASRSRPGYMALVAAVLVTAPLVASQWRARLMAGLAIALTALYFGDVAEFATRINDFVTHFAQDERWEIWLEALRLQSASSGLQWAFGHGFEQFLANYQKIAQAQGIKTYVAPHNFFMEIIFSHGVIGLALVLALYGGFVYRLVATTLRQASGPERWYGMVLIAMTTAHLVHGFFTLPFFSRDYLLPLSFLLGAGLSYGDSGGRSGAGVRPVA